MSNFKPSFSVRDNGNNTYLLKGMQYKTFVFASYRQLKSKMKNIMKEYSADKVTVSRSLRGEWGEYYEHWYLSGNKLRKGKEGWM
jgi:hypothetical protein